MEDLLKLVNSEASIAAVIVVALAIVVIMVANKYFETQKAIAESQPPPREDPEAAKALQDLAMAISKLNQFLELTEKNNEELRRRDNELMLDILNVGRSNNTMLTQLSTLCQQKKCPPVQGGI